METNDVRPAVIGERKSESTGSFAVKTLIVAFAALMCIWLGSDIVFTKLEDTLSRLMDRQVARVISQISNQVQSATLRGGREFWAKLERELEAAADPKNDIPVEKKQKLLAEIRAISDRWRPFLVEVVSVVTDTSNQQPGPKNN